MLPHKRAPLVLLLLWGTLARAQPVEIKVVGAAEHKLKPDGLGWSLRGPGVERFSLAPGGTGEWLLRDTARKVVMRAERGVDGSLAVSGPTGIVHRVRFEGEQYRVVLPDGKLVVRAKVKPDKANIYDSSGQRLRHVKGKPDGFSVKDESGTRVDKIKGPSTLREASFFALGLDFGEEALLFCAGNP